MKAMPIYSRTNQYWGINAHFHSRLQSEPGGWEVFHGMHISDIARALDTVLPPRYLIDPEKGLQALEEVEGIYLTGLAIREVNTEGELGKPITWIELLSPTNKPGGSGFLQYSEKRNLTLRSGIALVEIDYLHESRPVLSRLASYPDGEPKAYPYIILVTNPRPSLQDGQSNVYGCGVDERLPLVDIPLSGDEQVTLDSRSVYNQSFSSLASYSRRVDYERAPDRLDSYQPGDQERIRRRMAAVVRAYQQGLDLERGPFEVQGE